MASPIQPSALRQAAVQILTKLDQARTEVATFWKAVARKVISNSKSTLHAQMNTLDKVARKGEGYSFGTLSSQTYQVDNDDFGLGFGVGANDINDDTLHIYDDRIMLMAQRLEQFPDDYISTLITDGTTNLCIDGQAFFADVHYADPKNIITANTYDNNRAGLALSATNYNTAYAVMMEFPDAQGRPLGFTPTHLMVPPALRKTALDIIKAETLSTGGVNVNAGEVQVIVNPLLAAASTTWYLFSCGPAGMPFFVQEREPLTTYIKNLPNDDNMFFDDEMLVLAKGRGEFGYGIPQRALRAIA